MILVLKEKHSLNNKVAAENNKISEKLHISNLFDLLLKLTAYG